MLVYCHVCPHFVKLIAFCWAGLCCGTIRSASSGLSDIRWTRWWSSSLQLLNKCVLVFGCVSFCQLFFFFFFPSYIRIYWNLHFILKTDHSIQFSLLASFFHHQLQLTSSFLSWERERDAPGEMPEAHGTIPTWPAWASSSWSTGRWGVCRIAGNALAMRWPATTTADVQNVYSLATWTWEEFFLEVLDLMYVLLSWK